MLQTISQSRNPQEMLNQISGSNPVMQRALQMTQGKSNEEIKQTILNLGKQAGYDENTIKSMAGNFGLKF